VKLPRFLRHWAAYFLADHSPEVSGALYDYANERYNLLAMWRNQTEAAGAQEITVNMFNRMQDDIYIAVALCEGAGRGYFAVHDSNLKFYFRGFWSGIYEPEEAMKDVSVYCRKIADKMGYRRPDDRIGRIV
jgi:hypothetical protein